MSALVLLPLLSVASVSSSDRVGSDGPPTKPEAASRPSRKARRTRPILSRFCTKTKLCNFFKRGVCKRDDACNYAHDPAELQAAPDLSRTKLCPEASKGGRCTRPACTYAHSEAELRKFGMEEYEALTPSQGQSSPRTPSTDVETTSKSPSQTSPRSSSTEFEPATKTPAEFVAELNAAATSGALTQKEMLCLLGQVFRAMYALQPDIEKRTGMPPELLAFETMMEACAEKGCDSDANFMFEDVVRWCATAVCEPPQTFVRQPSPFSGDGTPRSRAGSEGAADMRRRCSDRWAGQVRNTFIHIAEAADAPCSQRRSRSVPSRLGKEI